MVPGPGLKKLLDDVSKHYEIVVFSASNKLYVEGVIETLQATLGKKLISKVFTNVDLLACTFEDGEFLKVKDIGDFFKGDHPRSEKKLVCVDDRITSFITHLSNVVPIREFSGNAEDRELVDLGEFLTSLVEVEDVREESKNRYNLLAHVGTYSWVDPSHNLDEPSGFNDASNILDLLKDGERVPVTVETRDGRQVGVNFYDQPIDEVGYTDIQVEVEQTWPN